MRGCTITLCRTCSELLLLWGGGLSCCLRWGVYIYLHTFHNHSKFFMTEFVVSKARAGITFIAFHQYGRQYNEEVELPQKTRIKLKLFNLHKETVSSCLPRERNLVAMQLSPKTPLFSFIMSGQPERTDGFLSRIQHLRVQKRQASVQVSAH